MRRGPHARNTVNAYDFKRYLAPDVGDVGLEYSGFGDNTADVLLAKKGATPAAGIIVRITGMQAGGVAEFTVQ